jgi:hypothetical protein
MSAVINHYGTPISIFQEPPANPLEITSPLPLASISPSSKAEPLFAAISPARDQRGFSLLTPATIYIACLILSS